MQSVISTIRRNQKIIFVGFILVVAAFYLLSPKQKLPNNVIKADRTIRHSIKHLLQEVKTNDTLFNIILRQPFLHAFTPDALQNYLRPEEFSNNIGSLPQKIKSDVNLPESYDIENDVLVYVHIQKVGGTVFNNHLISDLVLETPCQCEKDVLMNPCYCKTKKGNIWLVSWFTVGWPCGLHADWTMLQECVDTALNKIEKKVRKRRYLYITLLRDPISRYLSEWRHQRGGEHWEDAKLRCDGKRVSLFEVRPCFKDSWFGVSLREFMECPDNLATNRQTRMLADLTKSECYMKTGRLREKDKYYLRLKSANENLEQMPFFGLTRYQKETQKLFEKTFNVKFKAEFKNLEDDVGDERISVEDFVEMMKYIELDVQLYMHAKDLFMEMTQTVL